ncbi:MAG: fumarylacetoacetate hydrolase family protein [Hyphomicrobiaceae bacterium]
MSTAFDPGPAARLIAEAQNAKTLLKEIPEGQRPKTLAEGYTVQDLVAAQCGQSGGVKDKLAGWKIGLGSANAMKGANLTRPVFGRMFESRLFDSGDTVTVPASPAALIEIEIAFAIARDVAPTENIANPLDVVSRGFIVSEIVFSRFADRKTVGLPSFTGDSVGFHALVVGHEINPAEIPNIVRTLVVQQDGKEVCRAATGDDSLDPVIMLGHLLAHARERGLTLKKGDLVTTGSVSKPFEATSPASFSVRAEGVELDYAIKP